LQEWAQGRGLPLPVYETVSTTGPAHAPTFTVAARVEGQEPALAKGSSKRQAEQKAAAALMQQVKP
jgi:ribonuclease-3